jgi:hypothetical protein
MQDNFHSDGIDPLRGASKMNRIRLLVALLAACILIMPALSMPDNGNCDSKHNNLACSTCHKLITNEKKGCENQNPMMGPATDNAREQFCMQCHKSMMGEDFRDKQSCNCQKPTMGENCKDKQGCDCQKPEMGENGRDKQSCDSQKSMMGEGGKQMWQGQSKENPFGCQKSMMGEKGYAVPGGIKVIIINVKS